MDLLTILLLIPLLSALAILFVKKDSSIKWIALSGSVIQLIYAFWLTLNYLAYRHAGISGDMLFQQSYEWFKPLHIFYRTGVDGISLTMVLLTAMVVVAGILVSWKIQKQVKVEEDLPAVDGIHHFESIKFPLFDSNHLPYAVCTISTDGSGNNEGSLKGQEN